MRIKFHNYRELGGSIAAPSIVFEHVLRLFIAGRTRDADTALTARASRGVNPGAINAIRLACSAVLSAAKNQHLVGSI